VHTWVSLALSFAAGSAFGGAFAFLRFKSRLTLYRHFAEQRLAVVNQQFMRSYASAHGRVR